MAKQESLVKLRGKVGEAFLYEIPFLFCSGSNEESNKCIGAIEVIGNVSYVFI